MWSRQGGSDLREKHERGVDNWIIKHPIQAPVIGFAVTLIILVMWDFKGFGLWLGSLTLIFSVFLLIYGLVRKAIYIAEERKVDKRKVESNREKPDLSRFYKKQ